MRRSLTFIWTGETVSVNQWHRATTQRDHVRGKTFARIYQGPAYAKYKESLAIAARNALTTSGAEPFSNYVDMEVHLYLWKMKDSDGVDKPLGDALEDAGVVENDRLIRNRFIYRHYHRKSEMDMMLITVTAVSDEELMAIHEEQVGENTTLRRR